MRVGEKKEGYLFFLCCFNCKCWTEKLETTLLFFSVKSADKLVSTGLERTSREWLAHSRVYQTCPSWLLIKLVLSELHWGRSWRLLRLSVQFLASLQVRELFLLPNFSVPCCALRQLTTNGIVIGEHRKLSISVVLVPVFCRFEDGRSAVGLAFPSMSHPCTALAPHAQAEEISCSHVCFAGFLWLDNSAALHCKRGAFRLEGEGE